MRPLGQQAERCQQAGNETEQEKRTERGTVMHTGKYSKRNAS
jgi:hypothetical protein